MNIQQCIDDSQINVLMEMGSFLEKEMTMSVYLEAEGETPKVDGVNAIKRFWNWIRRCIYKIKTKINVWFTKGTIKKLIESLKALQKNGKADFEIMKDTYETMSSVIEMHNDSKDSKRVFLLDDFDTFTEYNPKQNYQELADGLKEISTRTQMAKTSNDIDPYGRVGEQVKVPLQKLIPEIETFAKIVEHMGVQANALEGHLANNKQNLSEEVIKSPNYQQYVRGLTYSMRYNMRMITVFNDIFITLNRAANGKNIDPFGMNKKAQEN